VGRRNRGDCRGFFRQSIALELHDYGQKLLPANHQQVRRIIGASLLAQKILRMHAIEMNGILKR